MWREAQQRQQRRRHQPGDRDAFRGVGPADQARQRPAPARAPTAALAACTDDEQAPLRLRVRQLAEICA